MEEGPGAMCLWTHTGSCPLLPHQIIGKGARYNTGGDGDHRCSNLQGSWGFERTHGPPQGGVGLPQETPGCPKRLSGLGVSRGSSRGAKGDGWRSMVCRNRTATGLAPGGTKGAIYAIGQSPGAATGVHPLSVAKPPRSNTRSLGRGSEHPLRGHRGSQVLGPSGSTGFDMHPPGGAV